MVALPVQSQGIDEFVEKGQSTFKLVQEPLSDDFFLRLISINFNHNYLRLIKPILDAGNEDSLIAEGREDSRLYGDLIIRDGVHIKELESEEVIKQSVTFGYCGPSELEEHLLGNRGLEGAYAMDGDEISTKIRFHNVVGKIKGKIDVFFSKYLPNDFLYSNGINRNSHKEKTIVGAIVGSKTSVGCAIATQFPGINAYQIKATSYKNLGIGKVVCFGDKGLKYEFFFDRRELEQDQEQLYWDKDHNIVGVMRQYTFNEEKQKAQLENEFLVPPDDVLELDE